MLAVQNIINDVRSQGDAAVVDYTNRFDGQNYTNAEAFRVSPDRLKASWDELSPELQASLKTTKARIEAYERSILYQDMIGEEISYVYHPLEVAGFYIPGGKALYPSTVLMTVVPALVAGVTNFVVTTPVFADTSITFAALYLCGVTDNVFAIGGAQAIAAMAYGTETIPQVDKICGPGNAFVAMAKRLVNGDVAIDAIAGPSEILLYVDDSIPVDAIVYDIFAQAEHDQAARTFLLCESQSFADKIAARIEALLPTQKRRDIIQASITNNHYSIVDTREHLIAILNEIAAEHVSIQHRDQDEIVAQVQYAGAVFKGYYAMEAIGDYVAGPSHVLPTGGTARFSHGLTSNDFRTANAVINIQHATYDQIAPAGELLAEAEGLYAHQASIAIRKAESPYDEK
ncbi:histidinol dehydrogenase [Aerococcus agrisoli]|uniref:Histidinol dehydrogenase n=2 Tax=Aerococcus agrisoli TaxID=2487350 RepID=A0A3N4GDW7_9LACT|nr:histidinol dehydrogenase [Aerococcus agrisoli]